MAVEDLYQKACEAVERANYDYAVELLREVLRQNPQYPDARIALRGTERRRQQEKGSSIVAKLGTPVRRLVTSMKAAVGKAPKKVEVYEDYLETSPSSFWALTKAAGALRKLGVSAEAVSIYKDALRLKPNHKGTLRALGDLLTEGGQHHEALKYLTHLSSLEPRNRDLLKEVRDLAATDHMTAHDMEGAESFRDLVRDKDETVRLEEDGRMAVTVDDLHRRIETLEKELEEQPDSINRILGLGRLYADTDQLSKAQKFLREQHKAHPTNYEIREQLGNVQLSVYDEGIRRAAEAAEANPADAAAAQKKDELRQRLAQFAIKEFTWRIQQHPTDRELQLQLGRVHYEAGNDNEAIAAFQIAGQDARYELESGRLLGLCFMRKGQHDLALDQFARAVERHPEMDDAGKELQYCRADALEQMGRSDEALDIYKRIYSQDITFRDVAQKVESLTA